MRPSDFNQLQKQNKFLRCTNIAHNGMLGTLSVNVVEVGTTSSLPAKKHSHTHIMGKYTWGGGGSCMSANRGYVYFYWVTGGGVVVLPRLRAQALNCARRDSCARSPVLLCVCACWCMLQARGLKSSDRFSKNDPYVKLDLPNSNQSFKTKYKSGAGAAARWEETFTFNTLPEHKTLQLQVYDKDTLSSDDLLGSTVVSLDPAFKSAAPIDTWCPLNCKKNRPAGEVRIVLSFSSSMPQQQNHAVVNQMAKYGLPQWGAAPAAAAPPAPPSNLPPGWQMFKDASGRPYYVNSATGATQWDAPGAAPPPPPPNALQAPLPAGWRKVFDTNSGKPYYVNDATKQTSWDVPSSAPLAPPPLPEW